VVAVFATTLSSIVVANTATTAPKSEVKKLDSRLRGNDKKEKEKTGFPLARE